MASKWWYIKQWWKEDMLLCSIWEWIKDTFAFLLWLILFFPTKLLIYILNWCNETLSGQSVELKYYWKHGGKR